MLIHKMISSFYHHAFDDLRQRCSRGRTSGANGRRFGGSCLTGLGRECGFADADSLSPPCDNAKVSNLPGS